MSDLEIVDYARIASQIRALEPRALTPDQLSDVLLVMEWMKQELISRDETITKRQVELDQKETALRERERNVVLRARTVDLAIGLRPKRSKLFHYLKR